MMSETRRLNAWSELQLSDLVFAYRKAKADCFFERSIPMARRFAAYEVRLESNLRALLERLRSKSDRTSIRGDVKLLGKTVLVAKKISLEEANAKRGKSSSGHAYFSDPMRALEHLSRHQRLTAEFRVASRFPVDFHILSALWVNRIGHRFDACLDEHAYGCRLRRFGDDGTPNTRPYHLRATGSMAPYFLAYRRWRKDGLDAMRRALAAKEKVIGLTLDIKDYFHRIDPSFIADTRFHLAIGLGERDDDLPPQDRTGLTAVESEFTSIVLALLQAWSSRCVDKISGLGGQFTRVPNGSDGRIGGIPIGVTACRVMANVLLREWDQRISTALTPIYYGRYVDDVFLVLRDAGDIGESSELLERIRRQLPDGTLSGASDGERTIHLGAYQGATHLRLQESKHRVFFLGGDGGTDLVEEIERQIAEISSERRLMPDPEHLIRSAAAGVLTATGDARETPDALRRADGASIRRLGWSIQLRNVETLERDLDPATWAKRRRAFYRFAKDHVLRPERMLDYFDSLPRLLGLAVASCDWSEATALYRHAKSAMEKLRRAVTRKPSQARSRKGPQVSAVSGVKLNGYRLAGDADKAWRLAMVALRSLAQDAILRAWPWSAKDHRAEPIDVPAHAHDLLKEIKLNATSLSTMAGRLGFGDLARFSLKEIQRQYGRVSDQRSSQASTEELERAFELDGEIETMRGFLKRTRTARLAAGKEAGVEESQESLLPYVFPTRPLSLRDLAELDPECVGLQSERRSEREAVDHWARLVS